MREISFEVSGLPPNIKKNTKSMSRIPVQETRLDKLQTKAREKLGCQLLTGKIQLTLKVRVGTEFHIHGDRDNLGDLDNFIAGVCDGLKGFAFRDDRHVVKIDAERLDGPGDHCDYTIELKGG